MPCHSKIATNYRVREGTICRKSTRCLQFYEWHPQPIHPALQRSNATTELIRERCRTYAPTLIQCADKLIGGKNPEIGQCDSVGEKSSLARGRCLLLIESGETGLFLNEMAIEAAKSLNERDHGRF